MGWQESQQYFAGSTLQRHSEKRTDAKYIVGLLSNPSTKYIAYNAAGDALLTTGADKSVKLALLSHDHVKPLIELNGGSDATEVFANNGTQTQWVFLGVEEVEGKEDVACFAIDASAANEEDQSEAESKKREALKTFSDTIAGLPATTTFAPFRPSAFLLPPHEGSALGTGRAILDWNKSSRFCPACGVRTVSEEAGFKRICPKPATGLDRSKYCPARRSTQSYTHPRLDNSIIVCIVSADGERIMLGRKKRSPPKFFSCVAGFQEPGESIEECVRREAREETGLRLSKVIYHSSQPWPMPSQLMIGCLALVDGDETFRPEEDEFEEARWFTRAEIVPAINRAATGEASFLNPNPDVPFLLAPTWAIAHYIIRAWAMEEVDVRNFDAKI